MGIGKHQKFMSLSENMRVVEMWDVISFLRLMQSQSCGVALQRFAGKSLFIMKHVSITISRKKIVRD